MSKSSKTPKKPIIDRGEIGAWNGKNSKGKIKPSENYTCVACGNKGSHFAEDCGWRDRECFKCKQPGHMMKFCPLKDEDCDDNDCNRAILLSQMTKNVSEMQFADETFDDYDEVVDAY